MTETSLENLSDFRLETGRKDRRTRLGAFLVFTISLLILLPTTGDLGLTWDEPAYRFSQLRSAEWWSRLAQVRSTAQLEPLLDPDALLYYWTYGRHGINFHPPLAGQLNLLSHAALGGLMKDVPARRVSSEIEFSLTLAIGFLFLAKRYGTCAGAVAAGSLFLMPRLFGQAHLAETDIPGLLLWVAIALAFWKGLNEAKGGGWRVLVGILLGLAFVEKMATVFAIVPLVAWLLVARLPRSFRRADWIDGVLTSGAMIAPLGVAMLEILRLSKQLPKPKMTDLFVEHPASQLPGAIFAVPLGIWLVRRGMVKIFRKSAIWGAERPALEIWTSILAFAPLVGWLGNPAWWRETLPRFAHYYLLNTDRRGSLPDIQILYRGQIYEYSLPWENAWVLTGITVPVSILIAAAFGLLFLIRNLGRDALPVYFFVHLVTLPVFRMLPTPGHDGVRLFLPTFFFLAAFAGWGVSWIAMSSANLLRIKRAWIPSIVISAAVLIPAAWQLVKIHPYELSYYNEGIGGPKGAWKKAGFELTYWYDAFNPETLRKINAKLPKGASVDFLNPKSTTMTFIELQSLGELRPDIQLGVREPNTFPYVWLLTQDSKASAFTRLLFAMSPWYACVPKQLDGLRVATVADPIAVSRAYALQMLVDARDELPPERPQAPPWVDRYAPWLGRLWGVGLTKIARLSCNEPLFQWSRTDPSGLLKASQALAKRGSLDRGDDPLENRLAAILGRYPGQANVVLRARPEALVEAVEILNVHPAEVRKVLTHSSYTDLDEIGGPLDRDLISNGNSAR